MLKPCLLIAAWLCASVCLSHLGGTHSVHTYVPVIQKVINQYYYYITRVIDIYLERFCGLFTLFSFSVTFFWKIHPHMRDPGLPVVACKGIMNSLGFICKVNISYNSLILSYFREDSTRDTSIPLLCLFLILS